MKTIFFLSTLLLSLVMADLSAQTILTDSSNLSTMPSVPLLIEDTLVEIDPSLLPKKNATFIKLNLTEISFRNYTVQLEQTLNKTISVSIAFRTMPEGNIPFQSQIISLFDNEDPDIIKTIENFNIGNYSFTPEIRFYIGKKGYGRGFYFSTFYRHSQFKVNNVLIDFDNEFADQSTIDLSGKVKSNTVGILMGVQWVIAKHFCIDWWIVGAHYGSAVGTVDGIADRPLTILEQNDIKEELESIDIPLSNTTVEVTANSAALNIDGPWAGIRAGLSVGLKF